MEPYFIEYYDSYYKGYNSTLGGDGGCGRICSDETRIKLSGTLEEKWGAERAEEIKQILIDKHPANNSNSRDFWLNSIKNNHASKTGNQNLPKGEKHPNYDHTVYTLEHKQSKEVVSLPQQEFLQHYHSDYQGGNFSSMIRGNRKSFRGWRLISTQH